MENKNLEKNLKLIVKTSFVVFIGLILSKILAYAYRIIIARYFGPEIYGLFTLSFTIVSIFTAIAGFGLAEGLLRYMPQYAEKGKTNEIRFLFKYTLKFYLISGLIASVLLFLFSSYIAINIFHNVALDPFIKIFSVMIIFSLFNNVFLNILRGFEHISTYSLIYNIIQNIARVGILSILILLGFSSKGDLVAISFVMAMIVTLLSSFLFCRYKVSQIFGKYNLKNKNEIKKEFLHYSWPILFSSLVGMIFYMTDSFSIGYYKSAVEVGLYNAAVPIAMLLGFIPELFMQLFFPLINREYSSKNYKLIEELSKQVTKWIFMTILPIFILIFFFPGVILNTFFGSQYLPVENALRLLLIGSFISALFTVSNNLMYMLGKSKVMLANLVGTTILNILLNSILVPLASIAGFDNSNGLIGAALATLISMTFLNALVLFQAKKSLFFIPLRRKMITILAMALISSLFLFYLRSIVNVNIFWIISISVIFLLTYGILLIFSKSLDKNDLMIVRVIWRKIFDPKDKISIKEPGQI